MLELADTIYDIQNGTAKKREHHFLGEPKNEKSQFIETV
jgi:hypothetical protein